VNERLTRRTYDQLNADEKVLAVLAAAFKPVSRVQALRLSGINYEQLDTVHKNKVDGFFTNSEAFGIVVSGSDDSPLYKLSLEKKQSFLSLIDVVSIYKQVGDELWNELVTDVIIRIKIVLASAYGPMDRREVLYFSQIDYDDLEPSDQARIDALFASPIVEGLIQTQKSGRTVFETSEELKTALALEFDLDAVKSEVGKIMVADVSSFMEGYDNELDD
jgi:hypothetical protein